MKGRQKHADRLKILSGQGRLIKAVGRVLYVGADMIRAEAHRSISAGSVSIMPIRYAGTERTVVSCSDTLRSRPQLGREPPPP